MSCEKWKKRILPALLVVILCIALAGCGGGDRINAPFESGQCRGKNLDDIVEQLESAGFTNIQTVPEETAVSFNADSVISVKIGSNTMWNSANSWAPDVKIVIKYYEYTGEDAAEDEPEAPREALEAVLDISVGGELGWPEFIISTNLPDGTLLSLEIASADPAADDYMEQWEATVQAGRVETGALSKDGEPFEGRYTFGVVMFPADQTEDVREIIGDKGEYLAGPRVESSGDYQYLTAEMDYITDGAGDSDALPLENIVAALEITLSSRFADCYTLTAEDGTITANVWADGVALCATLAMGGDEEQLDTWDTLAENMCTTTAEVQELLETNGHGDTLFVMQVLNDLNTENTLLVSASGMVFYDAVNEIDLLGNL